MLARSINILRTRSHGLTQRFFKNAYDEVDKFGTLDGKPLPLSLVSDVKAVVKGLTGTLRSVTCVYTVSAESVTLVVDVLTKSAVLKGDDFNDFTVTSTYQVKFTSAGVTVKPYVVSGTAAITDIAAGGAIGALQQLTNGHEVLVTSETYDMATVLDTLHQITS